MIQGQVSAAITLFEVNQTIGPYISLFRPMFSIDHRVVDNVTAQTLEQMLVRIHICVDHVST